MVNKHSNNYKINQKDCLQFASRLLETKKHAKVHSVRVDAILKDNLCEATFQRSVSYYIIIRYVKASNGPKPIHGFSIHGYIFLQIFLWNVHVTWEKCAYSLIFSQHISKIF